MNNFALARALHVLGVVRGRTKRQRIAAWLATLAVFGYIVAVALTRDPSPWTKWFELSTPWWERT